MDNTQYIGSPDRDRINIHEQYELRYWSDKFGISRQELKDAVEEVGTQVNDVEEYLNKHK
ncbi:DUF3606 domain-containing protein [Mucilaginibacter litoreus]|uniref:DUF3606 domain-containing protein n=1 Tax=Mucilaginibacter litoreus TaxID=1048221 RepID=A0ABW3AWK8_9SPHI